MKNMSAKGKKKEPTIKEGDFVLVEYTGYVKETNEVFDTTSEDIAKESNIYDPKTRYGPTLVIVGEEWLLKGVEESLIGKKENEEYEVEIPPEKGFGIRDSKKIRTTTIRKLRETGVKGDIAPGVVLEVDGKPAIVRAVVSGRVMLDFNPPLAGKYLLYKVKVVKILSKLDEKIRELIKHIDPNFLENVKLSIKKKDQTVLIELGDNALNNPNLHLSKKPIADSILKYIEEIKKVRFIDEAIKEVEEEKTESVTEEVEQTRE